MSHHRTSRSKRKTFTSLTALTAILVAAALVLAACGGSSSTTTTTQTTANAAATGTTTAATGTSGATSTGTSSTPTTPGAPYPGTTPAARAARFTAVRECLSKKGITLPQRPAGSGGFPGGVGGGAQLPKGVSRAQFAEALKTCGAGFNGNRFGKGGKGFHNSFNSPRFRAVLTRFAACLRQNGIDISEPNTSGKGPVFDTKGLNTGSTQFKAAEAKCRSTLLGAFRPNHAHPGTSATTTGG